MDEGIGILLFVLIMGIIIAIAAVRSGSSNKHNELCFQLKVMQKQLETIAETLKGFREDSAQRAPLAMHSETDNAAEAGKDAMETQPETNDNAPFNQQKLWWERQDEPTDEVPSMAEDVAAVNEQQRVDSPVTTIEVPVQPIDEPAGTAQGEPQHAEGQQPLDEGAPVNASSLGENGANAAQNDAEAPTNAADEQAIDTENEGSEAEEQLDNEAQEALQEHEPVAAFAENETAQEQGEAAQEQFVAGKDYLESMREQGAETDDDIPPYGGHAYRTPPKTDEDDKPGFNYEKFIGENLFGKIGILVFVLGIGFFVKYAIDQNWISPAMRTVLSYVVGTGLLGIAWKLGKRYRAFSSLLAGGGCAVYYVTTAIAYHYYQLFSQPVGFAIMVCVTLFMAWTAHHYDRRELAVTALVGGFLAPFLVGTDTPNFLFLYVYMAILNLGSLYLSWGNRWNELPLVSTGATYFVLLLAMDSVFTEPYAPQVAFYGVFWLIATMSCFALLRRGMTDIFTGFHIGAMMLSSILTIALVAALEKNGKTDEAITALTMGLVYLVLHLWMRRSEQSNGATQSVLLALALAYLSVSLPLFFKGPVLTVCFSAEMVLLLWLYCRLDIKIYGFAAAIALIINVLSFIGSLCITDDMVPSYEEPKFNFAACIFRGLCFLAFARIMDRKQERLQALYMPWNLIIYIVGVAALYTTIDIQMFQHFQSPVYEASLTLLRLFTLLAVAVGFGRRFLVSKVTPLYVAYMALALLFVVWDVFNYHLFVSPSQAVILQWIGFVCAIALFTYTGRCYYKQTERAAVAFTVFFNLASTALWVSMVRALLIQMEVEQFTAAFSLSLAAVGTVQMTLGMRLPNKTMRLLSIATFGFIIGKLALYDVWLMPAIGRIVVFIILGALLLTLSFLYQKLKDTLNLGAEEETAKPVENEAEPSDDEAQDLPE